MSGYDNQRRRGYVRAAARHECQLKPTRPTYVSLARCPVHLELELTPPVARQHAEATFDCFQGWVLHTLRSDYPEAFLEPHTVKPGGATSTRAGGASASTSPAMDMQ